VAASTHTPAEIAACAGLVDFVVYGPVWDTPSKLGRLAARGLEGLMAAVDCGIPVLALGGIDPARAALCGRAGAAGVACIRAVLGAADPAQELGRLLAATEAVKHPDREP
jgi:thiamine monophosphate synthase